MERFSPIACMLSVSEETTAQKIQKATWKSKADVKYMQPYGKARQGERKKMKIFE